MGNTIAPDATSECSLSRPRFLRRLQPRANVKAVLQREGTEVVLSKSPQDFASYLADDTRFWVKLVKQSGITTN